MARHREPPREERMKPDICLGMVTVRPAERPQGESKKVITISYLFPQLDQKRPGHDGTARMFSKAELHMRSLVY
jgi:hypothetical protein